jgi:hypothetical protein
MSCGLVPKQEPTVLQASFFPWSAGDRDQAWYDAKKADLPDWQLAQEYPDDPEEAFIRSGRPVFDLEAISLIEPIEPDRGYLKSGSGKNVYTFLKMVVNLLFGIIPDSGETMLLVLTLQKVWVMVTSVLPMLFLQDTGMIVAHWHGHVDPDIFGEQVLNEIGFYYNSALLVLSQITTV